MPTAFRPIRVQTSDSGRARLNDVLHLASRAPKASGYPALTKKFSPVSATDGVRWERDGYGQLSEEAFLRDFASDLRREEAMAYYAVQQRADKAIMMDKSTVAAWKTKPSWYAVSTKDRTIDSDLQRFMAKRMGATTVELGASHVSLLSRPVEVANLIIAAANDK